MICSSSKSFIIDFGWKVFTSSKDAGTTSERLSLSIISSLPDITEGILWRRAPIPSTSSIKTIQGETFLARLNKFCIDLAPLPRCLKSFKTAPDWSKTGTPVSPAKALINKVLPVPGGPTNNVGWSKKDWSLLNL